ncbi:non-ribosomal peptide synthetase [Paenibacillus tepidiphilus]|uniref:non-ribosomal peptide synthetase n=1 Tax=Paenibacillus tepidiphilus TaxID=2608683 RepID=UPI00123C6271|nr:non-ribosomal peptide synthetase [Paenibacillus tepidiphilus]
MGNPLRTYPPLLPAGQEEVHPLSYQQERLYFMSGMVPDSSVWNLVSSLKLQGNIDTAAMREAVRELAMRHDVLRSVIGWQGDSPYQSFTRDPGALFRVADFRSMPEEPREQAIGRLLQDLWYLPIRLDGIDLLFQAVLVLATETESILLLKLHHIIADGTSIQILWRDLKRMYSARVQGTAHGLPDVAFSYGSYARWQRETFDEERTHEQEAYWLGELKDEVPFLDLPADAPPSSELSFQGALTSLELPEELVKQLRIHCMMNRTMLFSGLMALFYALLHKLTGEQDIVVGTVFNGRHYGPEYNQLAGFFVNTVAVRLRFDDNSSFTGLLKQVHEQVDHAYYMQDYPFERLVRALNPERELQRIPLFRTMFNMVSAGAETEPFAGLQERHLESDANATQTDLLLDVRQQDGKTHLWAEYHTGLFKEETVQGFLSMYVNLLRQVAADPSAAISDLTLLDPAERNELIYTFNETEAPYPRDAGVHELFHAQADRTPERVALLSGEQIWSYRELNGQSAALARRLRQAGVEAGSIVGILAGRSPELIIAMLAVLQAGAAYLPLDPAYPPERSRFMLEDSGARLLLVQEDHEAPADCPLPSLTLSAAELGAAAGVGAGQTYGTGRGGVNSKTDVIGGADLVGETDGTGGAGVIEEADGTGRAGVIDNTDVTGGEDVTGKTDNTLRPSGGDSLAYVMYTSGSTGTPKGVMVTHRNVVRLVHEGGVLKLAPDDRILLTGSPGFDAVTYEIWAALLNGLPLVLAGNDILLHSKKLGEFLREQRITLLWLTTALFQQLAEEDPALFAPLRCLLSGGDLLPPRQVRLVREACPDLELWNMYGPTENTTFSTGHRIGKVVADGGIPIGRPVPNSTAYVLSSRGQLQPVGVPGELVVGGDGLAAGYLNRPELTAERFTADPFRPGQRMYKTGDRAKWLPGGELLFLGRLDQQVKIRGYRVEPGEVETLLQGQQGVVEAAITVREDPGGSKYLCAYVVCGESELEQLRNDLSRRLPGYMLPSRFVRLEKLPVTGNGKVDRRRLPDPPEEPAEVTGARAPEGETEAALAAIWSEVLHRETVLADDHFFECGGHSLRAMVLLSRIQERMGVELTLQELFAAPTIRLLAERIAAASPERAVKNCMIPRVESLDGDYPATASQKRMYVLSQMMPGGIGYNVPLVLRSEGKLEPERLERTLNALAQRHGSLRTSFHMRDGKLRQHVADTVYIPLECKCADDETEAREEVKSLIRPFDLGQAPLLRAGIVELAQGGVILVLDAHHIITDGVSTEILLRELAELYGYAGDTGNIAAAEEQPVSGIAASGLPESVGTVLLRSREEYGHDDLGSGQVNPDSYGTANGKAVPEGHGEVSGVAGRDDNDNDGKQPLQYKDYAVWLEQREGTEEMCKQEAYWLDKLSGELPVLNLVPDHPRPAIQSFEGDRLVTEAGAALHERLQRLAAAEGVTLYMALLAGYFVLLSRYSGQEDILVGTPVAGRQRPELQDLVGLFVNTLVLRGRPLSGLSFREFLSQVKRETLEAYEHQDTPFEQLVERLQPVRDSSRNPLFDTMFAIQHGSEEPLRLADARFYEASFDYPVSKFDLTVTAEEGASWLRFDWEYATKLFERETVMRMSTHYLRLLDEITSHPDVPLSELEMVAPEEKLELIHTFNSTEEPYPKNKGIHEIFGEQAARTPELPALRAGAHSWSYRELKEQSAGLARRLRHAGLQPGSIVGILAERSPELIIAMLAVLQAGAAYLPLDPAYPPERTRFMLEDSGAGLLLVQDSLEAPADCPLPSLTLSAAELGSAAGVGAGQANGTGRADVTGDTDVTGGDDVTGKTDNTLRPSGGDSLAYVMYTSGSTGTPKGVMVTHRNVVRLVHGGGVLKLAPDDRILLTGSPGFDAVTYEIWAALLNGLPLVLAGNDILLHSKKLGEFLREQRITLLWLTAALFQQLAEEDPALFAPLRCLLTGGDLVPPRQVRLVREACPDLELWNMYGPTENTTFSTGHRIGKVVADGGIPIGRPVPNSTAYVLSSRGQLQPVGVPGELVVGGDGLAAGYLNRPELTAERFTADPFRPGQRMYKTGDRAKWLPGGELLFLGRLDQQVKIRGYRVEPGEVETLLQGQQGVVEAAITVREDPGGSKYLCAYVVCGESELEQLRSELSRRLPGYMLPSRFVRLEKLPVTANGKVDRRRLPDPPEEPAEVTGARAPEGETEAALAAIWSEVLHRETVLADDHFFECGGHSLRAMVLLSRIQERMGVELTLQELFAAPTIRLLAERIAAASPERAVKNCMIPRVESLDGDYPATASQKRMYVLSQMMPGGIGYNVPLVLRSASGLEPERLERTLDALARRHGSLRTSFYMRNGKLYQRIADRVHIPLEHRWADEEAEVTATVQGLIRPFDLGQAPLLRAGLVELAQGGVVLVLDAHHIITDGVSTEILLRELAELYGFAGDSGNIAAAEEQPHSGIPASGLPESVGTVLLSSREESSHDDFGSGQVNPDSYGTANGKPVPEGLGRVGGIVGKDDIDNGSGQSLQYQDYAVWQEGREGTEELRKQEAYWLDKLSGELPVLNLIPDYPRPAFQSFEGDRLVSEADAGLSERLRQLAAGEEATLYMTLLAAYYVLLFKYSGQEDILVGTPAAGRRQTEVQEMVGLFVNTLVLRGRLRPDLSFREWLGEVKQEMLEALEHQDTPFERLTELLQPVRDPSRNPLFDTLFALQHRSDEPLKLGDATFHECSFDYPVSKFDLTLTAEVGESSLRLEWEYATRLYKRETVKRMSAHYLHLLEQITANPYVALAELELATADETEALLYQFNDTGEAYPMDKGIYELFRERAEAMPERTALLFRDNAMTYGELNAACIRAASRLMERGIGPGCIVAVAADRSMEMVIGIYSVLAAGAAYLPVDPGTPPERLRYLLEDSGSRHLLLERPMGTLPAQLELEQHLISELASEAGAEAEADESGNAAVRSLPSRTAEELAYVLYTSGSTGKPKGVLIEQRSLLNTLLYLQRVYPLTSGDTYLLKTAFTFDVSATELFGWFFEGGRLAILEPGLEKEPDGVMDAVRRYAVTHLNFSPSMLDVFLQVAARRNMNTWQETLKYVFAAGEALKPHVAKRFYEALPCVRLENIYGPTEITIYATAYSVPDSAELAVVPIGRPIANMKACILDSGQRLCPPGVPGELCLSGAGLAKGYLNRPELTAERFVAHPFHEHERMYRTGDQARWSPDGVIEYLGRIDQQVKIRGFRIEPGEIEHTLLEHPNVINAVVTAKPGASGLSRLIAYLVLANEGEDEDWSGFCRQWLPGYMIPEAFVTLGEIPLNASGKTDTGRLPDADVPGGREVRLPRTPEELKLVRLLEELLDTGQLGLEDNLFDYGANSIVFVQLAMLLEEEYQAVIPILELMGAPTAAAILGRLEPCSLLVKEELPL